MEARGSEAERGNEEKEDRERAVSMENVRSMKVYASRDGEEVRRGVVAHRWKPGPKGQPRWRGRRRAPAVAGFVASPGESSRA